MTPYSFINWANPNPQGVRLTNTVIDAIELYLSTNLNFTLSLNGQPWNCMLTFTEVVLPIGEPLPMLERLATLQQAGPDTEAMTRLQLERERVLAELETERAKILASIKRANERPRGTEDGRGRSRAPRPTLQSPTRG